MKGFILLTFFIGLAMADHDHGRAGDGHDDGCVDITVWSEVEFTPSHQDVCNYKCNKVCEKKSEEICRSVPTTTCEAKGYKECTNTPTTIYLRDDTTEPASYLPKECEPGIPGTIVEHKMMPQCKNETKEKCDSKWVIDDETGEKVWAGNINCREVTWQNCELVEVELTEEVPTYDCKPGSPVTYMQLVQQEVPVTVYQTSCAAKAVPVCTDSLEVQCFTVEWDECTETVTDSCNDVIVKIPTQQEDHTLRCPLKH